jgi:hypothetical protein
MSWLRDVKDRTATRLSGRLGNNSVLSEVLGAALIARASLPFTSDVTRLDALLQACRRSGHRGARRRIERMLRPFVAGGSSAVSRQHHVGWQRYYGEFGNLDDERALTTSLVLKAPRPGGEKGVLYCSFEYNWMRLLAHYDAAAILSDYYLVGASSWSPTDYASIAGFAGLSEDPIYVGVSNQADVERIALMRPVAVPLDIMASDWIDPTCFQPKPHRSRSIDLLMVANWSRVKRHWILFEALRRMPRHLRVVLVGRNANGRTEREIRDEAKLFGAPQDLELHTNLEIDEVYALQCDARVSAIFTEREGSCVATAESLFADSPVAMMEEAHIGSKAYVNDKTGILVRREGLARTLQKFIEESSRYTPRAWAVANIPCTRTSQRLNAILRARSLATGRPWTEDIAPMCWRYVPAYVNAADEARLLPAVEELKQKYGLTIDKFLGERETRRRKELGAAATPIEFRPEISPAPAGTAAADVTAKDAVEAAAAAAADAGHQ